jgi:hypothetical protein
MFGYPDAPFEIVMLSPTGLVLFILTWVLGFFGFFIIIKTPALKFLFGKLMVINIGENRVLQFRSGKPEGSLIYVKKRGYYIGDPNNVYMEGISKKPIMLTYGENAIPIDPKMADVADRLGEMGIKNNDDLNNLMLNIQNYNKEHPEDAGGFEINVLGESVSADKINNYFNRNERADLIEAEIHRRTATELMKKLNPGGEVFKWIIGVGIVLLMVFVGFAIFQSVTGGQAKVDLSELKSILQTTKVVSAGINTTGTGLG